MSTNGTLRVLLVGSGRVGLRTARLLSERGHDLVVIERRPDRCERIADEYVATVIEGDATRPSVLRQADLERTDVVAALTNTPGTNFAVCMAAKRLAPAIRTVMRTVYDEGEEYEEFVDAAVFPERAGARTVTNAVETGVLALETLAGNLEILEVRVIEGAPAAGRSLGEISLPRGSLVVSDADGDRIAGADTLLEPGRSYVVATEPDVSDEVMNLLQG